MVDTARNYLSIDVLKRTIDSLFINKMNVLHWHITDDESFPLLLQNYSIITHSTKFSDSEIYTRE
jgi:hexosaminidase